MQIHHLADAEQLAHMLAGLWAATGPDPFGIDLAVVPGAGFGRWLSQRLATTAAGDGLCAGVEFCSWDGLKRRLTGPDDPWRADRLAWLLRRIVTIDAADDPVLAVVRRHLEAAPENYPACHRIARQFNGYAEHRPAMLADWADGRDVGPDGEPLADNAWQARLWRLLVAELGTDPLTLRSDLLGRLRSTAAQVPARIGVLAPTRLDPGRVELLEALGSHHQVDLLMISPAARRPSLADSGAVRGRLIRPPGHQLNLSLAAVADESAALLPVGVPPGPLPTRETLLGWLQADLRRDVVTQGRMLEDDDRSVQVHLSHGPDRQVEVLREVLTAVLATDPSLEPRDIAVITRHVDDYAALVGAAFAAGDHPARGFRVQVADRSIAQVNPLVELLIELLRLPEHRLGASELLDLCARPAVALRFGFTAENRDRLIALVRGAGIRWGVSARHRARYGLAEFGQNTWFAGLQRMLLGVALPDGHLTGAGTVLPLDDVESTDVALIGGLTELVGRLSRLLDLFEQPAPLADWTQRCRDGLDQVASVTGSDQWQFADVWAGLARIAECGSGLPAPVSRSDVAGVVEQEFTETPTRGSFGNGSLLVSGPASLRQVPHRVVVLLGWDAGCYPRSGRRHGDDLLGASPRVGDPSASLDDRQSLLDAIHAATDQLIVICQGRSAAAHEQVPLAAPVAELLEAIDLTAVGPGGRPVSESIVVQHPLQPFDPAYFASGLPPLASADRLALQAAQAYLAPQRQAAGDRYRLDPLPLMEANPGVALDDLTGFFAHPARTLLRVRAGLTLGEQPSYSDQIPIEPDHLARWQVGERMLQRLRQGDDLAAVSRAEWLRGDVPPFRLGQAVLDDVVDKAEATLAAIPTGLGEPVYHDLALGVPLPSGDHVELVGRVTTYDGEIVQVEFSALAAKHRLVAWLRLLALAAAESGTWRARVIGRGRRAVYEAPSARVACELLGRYLSLYRIGLSRPLPASPRLGERWAGLRVAGRDPADPFNAKVLRTAWEYDQDPSWDAFFRYPAVLAIPRDGVDLPGADPSEHTLVGALAEAIWTPLLQAESGR